MRCWRGTPQARPAAIALQDGRRSLSWQALRRWVDGVAAELRARGLSGGDRVSIWISNRAEAIVTFLACAREGIACNPSLHRTFTCGEIGQLLQRLNAGALVTEPGWGADRARADLDAVLAQVRSLRAVFMPDTFPQPGPNASAPCADPDRIAYLAFTSGTTGSAQVRHALAQHPARQCARHGAELGARARHGAA